MKSRSSIWLFTCMVFVLPVTAFAIMSWYERNKTTLPVTKTALPGIHFSLVNQEGEWKTEQDWQGKIVVANFFFTHCPVICPKMTLNLQKVQAAYVADPAIQISSFTVDPEHDSTAALKKYADRYHIRSSRWNLFTGSKPVIYKLARNGFLAVATDGDGGEDDFIHSQRVMLVDTKKRIRGYYDGTSEKEMTQLISDIKKLKDEN